MKAMVLFIVLIGVACGSGVAAWAGAQTDELRQRTDRVVEILQSTRLSPADRRAAVRDLALDVFDVGEAARRALGPHWQRRTLAEREEFVKVFRELLEQTYVARIDEYGGERIEYVAERIEGDVAVVRAQIVTKAGTAVPVESRLARTGGRWLMYDVLIENVSLVANYRSQFDRIIRTSSYEELVRRLRERVAQLAARPPGSASR